MVQNGTFQYKDETVTYDSKGNPIPPIGEWSSPILCNVQLKTREERIYLGGEYMNIGGVIIVDTPSLSFLSVTEITKVLVYKGERLLGERKVIFIEDFPITAKIKIYI